MLQTTYPLVRQTFTNTLINNVKSNATCRLSPSGPSICQLKSPSELLFSPLSLVHEGRPRSFRVWLHSGLTVCGLERKLNRSSRIYGYFLFTRGVGGWVSTVALASENCWQAVQTWVMPRRGNADCLISKRPTAPRLVRTMTHRPLQVGNADHTLPRTPGSPRWDCHSSSPEYHPD